MYLRAPLVIGILVIATVISSMVVADGNDDTTLEIIDIKGGFGGVTAYIKNTGNVEAKDFLITISVKGGIFNGIDISKECSGCPNCGTTIPPGDVKSESTLEEEVIIGFGSINVVVTAEAENAELVREEATGFVIGPVVIIY